MNGQNLHESDVDLVNRQISRKAARNALLPSLSLVGFLWWVRIGRAVESGLQRAWRSERLERAHRFFRRLGECVQQHRSGLLRRIQSEYSDSQPGGKGGSVPFRTGISAGRIAP